MDILLIGGTGAIGTDLADILAAKGHNVYVTSRKQHDNRYHLWYLCGNAKEIIFLKSILKKRYDAIVDFMVYTPEEFRERKNLLLKSTELYCCISSARVYAASEQPITEKVPRLIDTIKDKRFLNSGEYSLEKAKIENQLFESEQKNWLIIRPTITYNEQRLQLGVFEKEYWLYRALQGKTIVFPRPMASKKTTMTYGKDVAIIIADLLEVKEIKGKVVNVANTETLRWIDIIKVYKDILEKKTSQEIKIKLVDDMDSMILLMNNYYQVYYSRMFNRSFNDQKLQTLCGKEIIYTPIQKGLEICVDQFIDNIKRFNYISWKYEAWADRQCGEKTKLKEIPGLKLKIIYLIYYYFPVKQANAITNFYHAMVKRK